VHGWYKRHPQDLPCFDDTVQLHIQVKRFQCLNKKCQQRTFAQRFPQWLAYKARRTERLQRHHLAVAYHVSGEAGRRLLACLKMPTSGDTLIRDIRRQPEGGATQARVIGIDDWAKRKGFSYGTIIVDLEKQQPIVNSGSKMVLAAF
jgi:transposase